MPRAALRPSGLKAAPPLSTEASAMSSTKRGRRSPGTRAGRAISSPVLTSHNLAPVLSSLPSALNASERVASGVRSPSRSSGSTTTCAPALAGAPLCGRRSEDRSAERSGCAEAWRPELWAACALRIASAIAAMPPPRSLRAPTALTSWPEPRSHSVTPVAFDTATSLPPGCRASARI